MGKKITIIILLVLIGLVGTAKAEEYNGHEVAESKDSNAPYDICARARKVMRGTIIGYPLDPNWKMGKCGVGGIGGSVGGVDYSLLAEMGADHDREGANKFRSFTSHAAAAIGLEKLSLLIGLAGEYTTLMGAFGTHWVWNTSGDPTRVYDLASDYAQLKPLVGLKLNAGGKVGIRLMAGPSALWDGKVRFNGGWVDWNVAANAGVVELRAEGSYEAFAKYVDNYGHRVSVLVGVEGKKGSKIAEIMKIGLAGEMIASKEVGHNVVSYSGVFLVLELNLLKPAASFVGNIGTSNASQVVGSFGIVGEAGAGSQPRQNLIKDN